MPRTARILVTGAVHHIISRFVDRSWQLVSEDERSQYLGRLDRSLQRARWRLLGYALMSNHVHILAEASDRPLAAWAKPLHVGMAQWLNRKFGRLGPVFADRPYCETIEAERVGFVLAYVHNNPVRAGLVSWAGESSWTSHRAYLGFESPQVALHIMRGLDLCGFGCEDAEREEFDAWVRGCASVARDEVPEHQVRRVLKKARQRCGPTVSLGTPVRSASGRSFPVVARPHANVQRMVDLAAHDVIQAVAIASGQNLLAGGNCGRPRSLTRARCAAFALWAQTGQPRSQLARLLGVGATSASRLAEATRANAADVRAIAARAMEILEASTQATGFDRLEKG